MRLVPQRGENDCGIAAIAMVAGVSYEQALERAIHHPDRTRPQGTHVWHALRTLYRLTGERWQVRFRTQHRRVRRIHLPPDEVALVMVDQRGACSHWIAWDGARLYDPSPDDWPLRGIPLTGQTPAAYSATMYHTVTMARVIVPRRSRWLPPALVYPHRHREPHLRHRHATKRASHEG